MAPQASLPHNCAKQLSSWLLSQVFAALEDGCVVYHSSKAMFGVAKVADVKHFYTEMITSPNEHALDVLVSFIPTSAHSDTVQQNVLLADLSILALMSPAQFREIEHALFWSCLRHIVLYKQKWTYFGKVLQSLRSVRMRCVASAAAHGMVYEQDLSVATTIKSPLHPDRLCSLLLPYIRSLDNWHEYDAFEKIRAVFTTLFQSHTVL